MSTTYHPETDGQSERTIQTLEDMLQVEGSMFKRCAAICSASTQYWGGKFGGVTDKLWSLVKERFSSTDPTDDKERTLWVELKRLFEPDTDDIPWKLQRYIHDPLTWRLYDICGVHYVSIDRGHDIFMLVEKDYPPTRGLLTLMRISSKRCSGILDKNFPKSEVANPPVLRILSLLPILLPLLHLLVTHFEERVISFWKSIEACLYTSNSIPPGIDDSQTMIRGEETFFELKTITYNNDPSSPPRL
ncbi:xylulose kinase-1 [Tanacetum coccineum]